MGEGEKEVVQIVRGIGSYLFRDTMKVQMVDLLLMDDGTVEWRRR